MKDKVVIVTGANRGIGFHVAKKLAFRGARVILACRSDVLGSTARDDIITATGNHDIIYRKLDLASLTSVREFAAQILVSEPQLHLLINNAAVYGCDDCTEDGIVQTMQINYVGHFLLTLLLLPLLKKSQPSRIVNVTSLLHHLGKFNPETISESKNRFLMSFRNYCDSKLCMLLLTLELSLRLKGTGVTANAVHPGLVRTGIKKHFSLFSRCLFWFGCLLYNRTPEQGAETVEDVAVSDKYADVSGKYFADFFGHVVRWVARYNPSAQKLWQYSEDIVMYKYV